MIGAGNIQPRSDRPKKLLSIVSWVHRVGGVASAPGFKLFAA